MQLHVVAALVSAVEAQILVQVFQSVLVLPVDEVAGVVGKYRQEILAHPIVGVYRAVAGVNALLVHRFRQDHALWISNRLWGGSAVVHWEFGLVRKVKLVLPMLINAEMVLLRISSSGLCDQSPRRCVATLHELCHIMVIIIHHAYVAAIVLVIVTSFTSSKLRRVYASSDAGIAPLILAELGRTILLIDSV